MEARLSQSYGDFGVEINQWNKVLCQSQNSDMVTKMVALMQTNEEIHTLLAEEIEKLKNSFGNIYEREKKLMDKIAQSKKNLAHFEDLTKRIGRNAAKTNLAYESLEEDAENIRVLENQLAVSLSTDLKDAILSYLLRLLVTSSQLHSIVNEYQSSLLEGYSSNMIISSRLAQENTSAGNHPQSTIQESPAGKFKSDTEGFKTPTEYSEREELIRGSKQLDTVLLPTPTSGFSGDNGVVLRNAEVPSTNKGATRGQRILSTFALYQPRETWG
ncbi:uncharacterized protein KQ657_004334 [Scheffersomyces spartinae]|uniref:Uncharacterized protein n=1 Tax=Scheffersomyces spartinae TaxID=45513 RepID=A0A9P7VBC2_9ASCO|nr:uncharacterized protein KQ657_004334 [Scheffersomyces spartinae]KAG7194658.1 hypothetical protein KQ657_004334 [Scheffersomyces spartinae]